MNNEVKTLLGVGLVTAAIIGVGVWLSTTSSTAPAASVDPSRLVHADSYQSAPNAKVTLVEFGDFQCPSCGAVYPLVKQLKADYGDKVNFVFRHFPLSMHKNADIAARAAEAAGNQGKFIDMHDQLFEHQNDWAESDTPQDMFIQYAESIGLNVDNFKRDIQSDKKAEDKIAQDKADGAAVKVQGTPTFFINNQLYTGQYSYAGLKAEIDKNLGQ